MAQPYGLPNQKLCYFQIYKILWKRQIMFLGKVGEICTLIRAVLKIPFAYILFYEKQPVSQKIQALS